MHNLHPVPTYHHHFVLKGNIMHSFGSQNVQGMKQQAAQCLALLLREPSPTHLVWSAALQRTLGKLLKELTVDDIEVISAIRNLDPLNLDTNHESWQWNLVSFKICMALRESKCEDEKIEKIRLAALKIATAAA